MRHELYKAGGRDRSGGSNPCLAARKLKRDQRGSILITTSLIVPALMMAVGMGIEISHWTVVKLELQRTADIAALAGATEYALASHASNAANAAANVAGLNGAAGVASGTVRTWNPSEKLLTDNQVVAQVTAGVRQSSDTALMVTVSQTVPLLLTRTMISSASVTLSAVSWAELKTTPQPCLVALSSSGSGVSAQGSPSLTMRGCSVRSNASITVKGNATMSASAFYANGSITESETDGPDYPNSGTIPDPYATHAAVQAAFKKLVSGSGDPFRDKPKEEARLDLSHPLIFLLRKTKGLPLSSDECCSRVRRTVPSHPAAFEDKMHEFQRMSQSGQMGA